MEECNLFNSASWYGDYYWWSGKYRLLLYHSPRSRRHDTSNKSRKVERAGSRLVFGRCFLSRLRVSWFYSVSSSKFQATTSIRPQLLASKSFPVHHSTRAHILIVLSTFTGKHCKHYYAVCCFSWTLNMLCSALFQSVFLPLCVMNSA
jgi:hypothetical protein